MPEPAHKLPEEDQPDITPGFSDSKRHLRAIEGGGEGAPGRGDLHSVPSGSELADQEQAGGAEAGSIPTKDLRQADADGETGDNPNWFNRAKDARRQARSRFTSRLGNFAKKHPFLLGGALAGSSGLLLAFMFIFFFLGTLQVPNLAEHITSYQFARLSRDYAEHVGAITSDKVGVDTSSNVVFNAFKSAYGGVKTKWGAMWDHINYYRPDKVVQKLQTDGKLDFKYEPRFTTEVGGKQIKIGNKLTAVVVDGQDFPAGTSKFNSLVHPVQSFNDSAQLSSNVIDALNTAMEGRSVLFRGLVARSIRQQYGIRLQWWNPKTYEGKTQLQADAQALKDTEQNINQGEQPVDALTQDVKNASEDAQTAVEDCLANESCAEQAATEGSTSSVVTAAVEKDFSQGAIGKVTQAFSDFFNPVAAFIPACMVYDASLESKNAPAQIDRNDTIDARTYYAVGTMADQQRYGSPAVSGEAIGSGKFLTGSTDVSQSIPEMRAAGQSVDTINADHPQASATGEYTFLDAVPYLGPVRNILESLAGPVCPVLSDPAFNFAAGGIFALTGGVLKLVDAPLDVGTTAAVKQFVSEFAKSIVNKKSAKSFIKVGAGVAAATVLAKWLVMQRIQGTTTATTAGPSFDEHADAGGDYTAQLQSQRFYGRPMSSAEVAETRNNDQAFQNNVEVSSESISQRYFAFSNPNSLVTRFGLAVEAHLNPAAVSDLLKTASTIFSPVGFLVHNFGSLNPSVAMAAGAIDNQDYGIVQFGWSNEEEQLINTKASYRPLQNQKTVATRQFCMEWRSDSNDCKKEGNLIDYIPGLVNACFGYDASGSVDASDTMGHMLAGDKDNSMILRDSNGDILADGANIQEQVNATAVSKTVTQYDFSGFTWTSSGKNRCRPAELGPNNNDIIQGPGGGVVGDYIFRYRLENNYEMVLDQLQSVQDAQTSQ